LVERWSVLQVSRSSGEGIPLGFLALAITNLKAKRQTGACLRLCAGRQQQFSPTEKQIDQRASDKQPVRIFLQSSVAQLHKSELQLHHLKHMLHLRTHTRFASVLRPLLFVNPMLVPVATMGVVLCTRCALLNYMALSLIGLITPNPGIRAAMTGPEQNFM